GATCSRRRTPTCAWSASRCGSRTGGLHVGGRDGRDRSGACPGGGGRRGRGRVGGRPQARPLPAAPRGPGAVQPHAPGAGGGGAAPARAPGVGPGAPGRRAHRPGPRAAGRDEPAALRAGVHTRGRLHARALRSAGACGGRTPPAGGHGVRRRARGRGVRVRQRRGDAAGLPRPRGGRPPAVPAALRHARYVGARREGLRRV
ncbi:MAG: Transcriptional regulator, AraC family, partial [uncultured Gemmatimonadaceae bacterium]